MSYEKIVQGLSLKVGPLGENDRLLTLLSDEIGLTRIAVPGARRPNSSLSGATTLSLLQLHIVGRSNLKRVRQLKIIRSFNNVGKSLETLAASQALAELTQMLVPVNEPIPNLMTTVLVHLETLEQLAKQNKSNPLWALATAIQACMHLLALGGYGLPIQKCCYTGHPLNPPIGNWDWRCSLIPEEGFAIGSVNTSTIQLNPSELALLQRLIGAHLPICANGELMGPKRVWLTLLKIIEIWIETHLPKKITSLSMLREIFLTNDL